MNRVLSAIALAALIAPLSILGYLVPHPDLLAILALTVVLVLCDVIGAAWRK